MVCFSRRLTRTFFKKGEVVLVRLLSLLRYDDLGVLAILALCVPTSSLVRGFCQQIRLFPEKLIALVTSTSMTDEVNDWFGSAVFDSEFWLEKCVILLPSCGLTVCRCAREIISERLNCRFRCIFFLSDLRL